MVRARFKPITPDVRIRELRKQFKALRKADPSAERAREAAAFAREAHGDRQLNMAMHSAQLSLEDDPNQPELLIEAYLPPGVEDNGEEHLRSLIDLADLARYIERDDIKTHAEDQIHDVALAWARDAEEHERRHRLRTLVSMFDRAFADDIRDEIGR